MLMSLRILLGRISAADGGQAAVWTVRSKLLRWFCWAFVMPTLPAPPSHHHPFHGRLAVEKAKKMKKCVCHLTCCSSKSIKWWNNCVKDVINTHSHHSDSVLWWRSAHTCRLWSLLARWISSIRSVVLLKPDRYGLTELRSFHCQSNSTSALAASHFQLAKVWFIRAPPTIHLLMKLLLLIMQILYEIHMQTRVLLFVKPVIHQNVNKMSSVNYCAARWAINVALPLMRFPLIKHMVCCAHISYGT